MKPNQRPTTSKIELLENQKQNFALANSFWQKVAIVLEDSAWNITQEHLMEGKSYEGEFPEQLIPWNEATKEFYKKLTAYFHEPELTEQLNHDEWLELVKKATVEDIENAFALLPSHLQEAWMEDLIIE